MIYFPKLDHEIMVYPRRNTYMYIYHMTSNKTQVYTIRNHNTKRKNTFHRLFSSDDLFNKEEETKKE